MNIEPPSWSISLGRDFGRSALTDKYETATVIFVIDVVASVELSEFYFDDTIWTDSTPFCLVCLNKNSKTSRWQQMESVASFIQTSNRNATYWPNRKRVESSGQSHKQQKFSRGWNCRGGWSNHDQSSSSNWQSAPSSSKSENINRDCTNCGGRLEPPPSNRI